MGQRAWVPPNAHTPYKLGHLAAMLLPQHASAPPGREEQPEPPQVPHEAAQHGVPMPEDSRSPPSQFGSASDAVKATEPCPPIVAATVRSSHCVPRGAIWGGGRRLQQTHGGRRAKPRTG